MDSYDIICDYVTSISRSKKVSDLDLKLIDVCSFFGMASNAGRIYPFYEFGYRLIDIMEIFGLNGTVAALEKIGKVIRESNGDIDKANNIIESDLNKFEGMAEGDFDWADPVLEYMKLNRSLFSRNIISY